MAVQFHNHDQLRLFVEIARFNSFSDAAIALNMTKGAISYQIKTLEADLHVNLFRRSTRGVTLTGEGTKLLTACQSHYEEIENAIIDLKGLSSKTLTVGVSTYFAARWLSPLLMSFMQQHVDIQLRIQPMIQLSDWEMQDIDIAIKWGNGDWPDAIVTPFMAMPTFPVGNKLMAERVKAEGIERAIASFTLLRDRDDSNAWSDWLTKANLPQQSRRDVLIVPDPNVRVQSVIDGQGIALMDNMVSKEIEERTLFRLSNVELSDYGYFLVQSRRNLSSDTASVFSKWVRDQI